MLRKKKKKESIEELFFKSEEERCRIATFLIPKIQARLEQALIFDYLKIRTVEPGEIISKQKSTNHTAAVISESGEQVEIVKIGNTVFPPEFIITSNPIIPVASVLKKQYNLLEKIVDIVVDDFIYEITKSWYELLRTSALASGQYIKFNTVDKIKSAASTTYDIDFIKKSMARTDEEEYCLAVGRDMLGKIHRWSKQHEIPVQELFDATVVVPEAFKESENRCSIIPNNILICFPEISPVEMDVRVELCVLGADQLKGKNPEFGFLYLQIQSLCIRDCFKISIIELPEKNIS